MEEYILYLHSISRVIPYLCYDNKNFIYGEREVIPTLQICEMAYIYRMSGYFMFHLPNRLNRFDFI